MTDTELLRMYAVEGSREALSELIRRHVDMVYAVARRGVPDDHLAEDVTQAVFLILMRRASGLSAKVVLGGWLFQVTLYAAADARKKHARRERHEREAAAMHNEFATPDDSRDPDLDHELHEAIAQLRPADRSAIVLRYLEGKTAAEIAEVLGTNENGARQRIFQATQRLRKRFLTKRGTLGVAAFATLLEQTTAHAAPVAIVTQVTAAAGGTVPSAGSLLIVKGVLHMMRVGKIKIMTVALLVVAGLLGGSTILLSSSAATPPALHSPAATAPAFAPANTPKGTVLAAYHAALAGDETALVNCFDDLSDDQKTAIKEVAQVMSASEQLLTAVGDKFGPEMKAQLMKNMSMAVEPKDVDDSKEKIDGDTATVDMGSSGPGIIRMVKIGDVWKVSREMAASMNANTVDALAQKVPLIKTLAADIKVGKYATPAELQPALMKILAP